MLTTAEISLLQSITQALCQVAAIEQQTVGTSLGSTSPAYQTAVKNLQSTVATVNVQMTAVASGG